MLFDVMQKHDSCEVSHSTDDNIASIQNQPYDL